MVSCFMKYCRPNRHLNDDSNDSSSRAQPAEKKLLGIMVMKKNFALSKESYHQQNPDSNLFLSSDPNGNGMREQERVSESKFFVQDNAQFLFEADNSHAIAATQERYDAFLEQLGAQLSSVKGGFQYYIFNFPQKSSPQKLRVNVDVANLSDKEAKAKLQEFSIAIHGIVTANFSEKFSSIKHPVLDQSFIQKMNLYPKNHTVGNNQFTLYPCVELNFEEIVGIAQAIENKIQRLFPTPLSQPSGFDQKVPGCKYVTTRNEYISSDGRLDLRDEVGKLTWGLLIDQIRRTPLSNECKDMMRGHVDNFKKNAPDKLNYLIIYLGDRIKDTMPDDYPQYCACIQEAVQISSHE